MTDRACRTGAAAFAAFLAAAGIAGAAFPAATRAQDRIDDSIPSADPASDPTLAPEPDMRGYYRVVWSEYWGIQPEKVDLCFANGLNSNDTAVAMFLAYQGRRDVDDVIALRRAGRSWWDIAQELNVAAERFFTTIPENATLSSPFEHAYSLWRKRAKDMGLLDAEAADLVYLQVFSRYYAMEPIVLIRHREAGRPWWWVVRDQHGMSRGVDVAGRPVSQMKPQKPALEENGDPALRIPSRNPGPPRAGPDPPEGPYGEPGVPGVPGPTEPPPR